MEYRPDMLVTEGAVTALGALKLMLNQLYSLSLEPKPVPVQMSKKCSLVH